MGRLGGRALLDRHRTIGTSPVGRAHRLRRPGWLRLLAGWGGLRLLAGLGLLAGWGWLWLLAGWGWLWLLGLLAGLGWLLAGWGWLWLLAGWGWLWLLGLLAGLGWLLAGWGWLWLLAGLGLLRLRPGWGWLRLGLLGLGLRSHLPRAVRLAKLRGVEPGRHEPGQRLAVGPQGRRVDADPVGTRSKHLTAAAPAVLWRRLPSGRGSDG